MPANYQKLAGGNVGVLMAQPRGELSNARGHVDARAWHHGKHSLRRPQISASRYMSAGATSRLGAQSRLSKLVVLVPLKLS